MKNSKFLTLFIIVFLDLMGIGIMIPVLAPMMLDPMSTLVPTLWTEATRNIALGVLVAVYPLGQFFGAPILGTLSDRYGRKKMLSISLIGTFFGYLLFAVGIVTQQLWLLYFSRALDGFTGGNISVANSAIADMSTDETRAKNFGLIGMAFGLGFVVGPFLGGKLADPSILPWFGPAVPFYFAALLSALSLTLLTFFFKETLKNPTHQRVHLFLGFQHIAKSFHMKHLRSIFLVVFLHALGFCFYTQFMPVFLVQKYEMSSAQIGTLFGFVGIWIALSQGLFTRIAARYLSPQGTLRFSILCLSATLFVVPFIPSVTLLYLSQPFLALFEGLTFPNTTAVVSQISKPSEQGEAMGITQSLRALGQAIPSLVAGFLVTINENLAILTGAVIILLAWIIFVISFKPKRSGG
ncbi:MAG: MFS transporter [Candidatus Gracilibacteria bacterium]